MATPRDILLTVSSMGSGGAERVAAHLANAWTARGERVTLVITFSGRGECYYPLAQGVAVVYLADLARRGGRGFLAYCARFIALRKLIRHSRPDVIVSFLSRVNVAVLLASLGLGCRVVVSERIHPPMLPPGAPWQYLRRALYPRASAVVMLSQQSARWLEAEIKRARGVVIPNPVALPLPVARPSVCPEQLVVASRKLVLAVGRLERQKGFDVLLQAFAHLARAHPCWDLVVLGDGSLRGALEAQVADLGLADRVLLPGRVGNMGAWYARADLYVLSSRFEGFPNTLIEAMAHGCPAVSFDCDTGPRDIIRHACDGLLVAPVSDSLALAAALDRLMGDDAERMRMGGRAAEVRERYALPSILARWDRVLDATLTAGTRA
jgi:glycosyltransferase involved in cell wall biosynthesis